MKSAAVVRQQVEDLVSHRMLGALSPRQRDRPERIPCGVSSVDALLQGGVPVGSVTELVGAECSGRTTIALAYVAAMTQAGGVCAWIDANDTLQPESAAASGVDLERLLWVRCGSAAGEAPVLREVTTQNVPGQAAKTGSEPRRTGCGSPHPRSEGKDMPQAVEALMQAHAGSRTKVIKREQTKVGTPSAPNRPLSYRSGDRSGDREEQVNSDRLPPRRGDNLTLVARCAEPLPRRIPSVPSGERILPLPLHGLGSETGRKPWPLLDQALRVADLLLQGGGFSCIVLDLGSIPPEAAWRIPLATWFRFRTACERTRISLVLLTQHPCARSSAELVVRLQSGSMEVQNRVMTGIRYHSAIERSRGEKNKAQVVAFRKPPQSERLVPERPGGWKSEVAWARAQ